MPHVYHNQTEEQPQLNPDVGTCYSYGWKQLMKYFIELLLISIIGFVIAVPLIGLGLWDEVRYLDNGDFDYEHFHYGPGIFFVFIFSFAYSILIVGPVDYGVKYAFYKAAAGEKPDVQHVFDVFKNYMNAVFANLLVSFIVGFGFLMLIIPGIIFACKLAFVPYLIIEKRLDAVEAIRTSWDMTHGHTINIFFLGFLAFFIGILGFLAFFVGIIVAIMWINLAFGVMYYAVKKRY